MKPTCASMAALLAIALTCPSQATTVTITSPDRAETRSDSTILARGLHWNPRAQELTAVITFSNQDYVSPTTHREENTFAFTLPGVRYDSANKVFYATARNGKRTPVAIFTPFLIGKKIQLLPGATVFTEEDHGNISVKFYRNPELISAPHWKEIPGPALR